MAVFEYLDEVSEIIYIADVETFELLYLNDSGRSIFGVGDDAVGRPCYEVLQGRDAPCPFCTNSLLSEDKNYTWEFPNPLSGHTYLLKDKLINWEGRKARLEVAFDMTDSNQGRLGLRNALDAENVVLQCAHELYQEVSVADAANNMLRRIGEYLSSERAYLFEYLDESVSNTFEWCAAGIEPEIDSLQQVDKEVVARWTEFFERGECVIVEDMEVVREISPREYDYLAFQGVRTLAAAPLEQDGRVVGFIGLDNPPADKIRNIGSLLKMLGYFFMSTVQRIRNEDKLIAMSFHDELTGLYNRNRYMADIELLKDRADPLGIVFLDVNDLKEINDQYGHVRGDEALRTCAAKMVEALGDADLYRIGGDEFVALLPNVTEDEFASRLDRLERVLERVSATEDRFVAIGSRWTTDSSDVLALLLEADADMYEKKRRFHLGKAFSGRLPGQLGLRPQVDEDVVSGISAVLEQSALLREYNMLMSALHVSVSKHLFTEKFEVVWANDFYYEMIGYTREEYVRLFNNNCFDYFAGERDKYERMAKTVLGAYEAGQPGYELLLNMPINGGGHRWIRVVGMFTDEKVDGVPVIYSTFADVDDVVQMRREQSITYDNLPGFVAKYRVAADGPKLLYCNDSFKDFFGEVDSSKTYKLFMQNLEMNRKSISEHFPSIRAGEPFSFGIEAVDAEGVHAWFTVVGDCVGNEEGDPVYLVLYLDTTELTEQRRLAENTSEELRKLAFVDPVTNGRNRTGFELDAGSAVAAMPANSYALVSLDVQKFKVINDQFGIEGGDRVLARLYDSFASQLDEGEFVARISADQFNLLLRADTQEKLRARIERISDAAGSVASFDGMRTYVLTMAVGVYVVDDPTLPMMQIQDRANVARKKTEGVHVGRSCACRFYSNEDRVRLAVEKEIENRMRDALDDGEFEVYLQPKFDLRKNACAGAEALVRWNDPVKGLVSPNDFIPLFEKNGFVVDLDLHVFEQVCLLLKAWQEAGVRPVPVSVNMSRAHLGDSRFLDRYEEVRKRCGVPASLIEIELTETLVFEDPEALAEVIDIIHQAGYLCSMDDFGSGYSSLNVLKNLSVDTLKLDRAFFDGPDFALTRGADVVELVIELARRLHMKTVAEGVETEEQAAFLKRAGCDLIQGYLFSRPLPVRDFEQLVFDGAVSTGRLGEGA